MKKLIFLILASILILTVGCTTEYDINIEKNIEEAGEVIGEGNYELEEEVQIAAVPKEGYKFINWEVDDEAISEEQIVIITVNENNEIKANFKKIKQDIFVHIESEDNDEIELGPYKEGEEVEIEAYKKPKHKFLNWSLDGEIISEEEILKLEIPDQNINLEVNYENVEEEIYQLIEKTNTSLNNKEWKKATENLEEADKLYGSESFETKELNLQKVGLIEFVNKLENKEIIDEESEILTEMFTEVKRIIRNSEFEEIPELYDEILSSEPVEIYKWFKENYEVKTKIIEEVKNELEKYEDYWMTEEAYNIYKEMISTILKGSIHTRMYEVDLSDDNFDNNFYIFNSNLGSYRNPFEDKEFIEMKKNENTINFYVKSIGSDNGKIEVIVFCIENNENQYIDSYSKIFCNDNTSLSTTSNKILKEVDRYLQVDELVEEADEALAEKRWSDAGEYLDRIFSLENNVLEKYNIELTKYFLYFDVTGAIDQLKKENITKIENINEQDWEDVKPQKPRLEILEEKDGEIYEWFADYYEFYNHIYYNKFGGLVSENALNKIKEISLEYSEKPIQPILLSYMKVINNGIYVPNTKGEPGMSAQAKDVFIRTELIDLEKENNKLIFSLKRNSDFQNYYDSLESEFQNLEDKFKIQVEIHEKEDSTFRVGETSFIFE